MWILRMVFCLGDGLKLLNYKAPKNLQRAFQKVAKTLVLAILQELVTGDFFFWTLDQYELMFFLSMTIELKHPGSKDLGLDFLTEKPPLKNRILGV